MTFDCDAKKDIEPVLKGLGFKQGRGYFVVGKEQADKRSIEGLLPDWVKANVFRDNLQVVSTAVTNESEKKEAQSKLKELYYQEFVKNAKPNEADCGEFYALVKNINKLIE